MTPFKLITACPNPPRHGTEVSYFSPCSSLLDTANPLCQSFAFSPDQTPHSFPSFLLGPVLQISAGLSHFLHVFPQMQCPTLAPVLQRCQSTSRRNTGHSKSILLFMEDRLLLLGQDDAGKVVCDPSRSQDVFQQSPSNHSWVVCTANSFTRDNSKPTLMPLGVNDGASKLIFRFCPKLFENLIPPPKCL